MKAKIHELEKFREQRHLFADRAEAGETLAAMLQTETKARETVVAVPTAPQRSIDHIISEVDNLFCANIRTATFFAVAEAYRNWYDLSEKEVIDLVHKKARQPCLREKKCPVTVKMNLPRSKRKF